MRYTGHFLLSFFVLLGGGSTLPAEETPGWRPKDGVQPPAVLTKPVVDLQDSFESIKSSVPKSKYEEIAGGHYKKTNHYESWLNQSDILLRKLERECKKEESKSKNLGTDIDRRSGVFRMKNDLEALLKDVSS